MVLIVLPVEGYEGRACPEADELQVLSDRLLGGNGEFFRKEVHRLFYFHKFDGWMDTC